MDLLLLLLFVLNIILVLIDVSVAYHKAPYFVSFFNSNAESAESGAKKVKSLLPLIVALYVTLDCYAYSLRHSGYLVALALVLVGDIVLQYIIARKSNKCEE